MRFRRPSLCWCLGRLEYAAAALRASYGAAVGADPADRTYLQFRACHYVVLLLKYAVTIFLSAILIRILLNPRYAPFLIPGRLIVRNQSPEYVGAAPKKFAWIIGTVPASVMFAPAGPGSATAARQPRRLGWRERLAGRCDQAFTRGGATRARSRRSSALRGRR